MIAAIIGLLSGLLLTLIEFVLSLIMFVFSGLFLNIGIFLLDIIDFVQTVFRQLAGLDTYYMDGSAQTGDILFRFISSPGVQSAFYALLAVAIFLLLLFTFIQVFRLEYTTEGAKNSKGELIKSSLKALAMFIIIPVSCFFGIALSNGILKLVDVATSSGSTTTVAGQIFKVAVHDANPIRTGELETKIVGGIASFFSQSSNPLDKLTLKGSGSSTTFGNDDMNLGNWTGTGEDLAMQIDNTFSNPTSVNLKNSVGVGGSNLVMRGGRLSYKNYFAVNYFYNITKINYIMLYVGGWFALSTLVKVSVGLVMRLYTGTLLFIISPPIIAITPLDGGNAMNSWKKSFISTVLGGYGTVVALNLFFQLIPLLLDLELFPPDGQTLLNASSSFYNSLMQLIFVLVGCYMIKDMSKLISGLIGADDALEKGEGMTKNVSGALMKGAGIAAGVATGGVMLGKGIAGFVGERKQTKKAKESRTKLADLQGEQSEAAKKLTEKGNWEELSTARDRQMAGESTKEDDALLAGDEDYQKYLSLGAQVDDASKETENIEHKVRKSTHSKLMSKAYLFKAVGDTGFAKALSKGSYGMTTSAGRGEMEKTSTGGSEAIGKMYGQVKEHKLIRYNERKKAQGEWIERHIPKVGGKWGGYVKSKADYEYDPGERSAKRGLESINRQFVKDPIAVESAKEQVKKMQQTNNLNADISGQISLVVSSAKGDAGSGDLNSNVANLRNQLQAMSQVTGKGISSELSDAMKNMSATITAGGDVAGASGNLGKAVADWLKGTEFKQDLINQVQKAISSKNAEMIKGAMDDVSKIDSRIKSSYDQILNNLFGAEKARKAETKDIIAILKGFAGR